MKKTFDVMAWIREVRETHYELLKDKTPEERIEFYRAKAEEVYRKAEKQREARDEKVLA